MLHANELGQLVFTFLMWLHSSDIASNHLKVMTGYRLRARIDLCNLIGMPTKWQIVFIVRSFNSNEIIWNWKLYNFIRTATAWWKNIRWNIPGCTTRMKGISSQFQRLFVVRRIPVREQLFCASHGANEKVFPSKIDAVTSSQMSKYIDCTSTAHEWNTVHKMYMVSNAIAFH